MHTFAGTAYNFIGPFVIFYKNIIKMSTLRIQSRFQPTFRNQTRDSPALHCKLCVAGFEDVRVDLLYNIIMYIL